MREIISIPSLEELPWAAQKVLDTVGNRHIVALYGAMGAGKTTFVKALCHVLDVTDQVNSPTFTLINEYKTKDGRMVYHFDFYRIKKIEEAYDLGYDEYFDSDGLCLIEWPELIEDLLPENIVRMYIRELPGGVREIVCE
jgi:tRNA threonylcarbamoyladenosine biosynthesis protein TsaE